ncbi:4'-phosphopantetheinyl transferase superfamily protein [Roseovarius salis]|uniref:4'-phosphopantetheinyl transferase family protein n=1 Tax=Roseovarius salis TaxID=3376063 RepID=UPI0037CB5940
MTLTAAPHKDEALAERIRALFLPNVSVAVTDPTADHAPCFAAEAQVVAGSRESRRKEFLAGRAAVHRAMEKMGMPPAPVLQSENRAPVWPANLTGSISHGGRICVAVVAPGNVVSGLGIDVEEDTPLDEDLVAGVCTLPERAWLSTRPAHLRGRLAKLVFSAKECTYKCQFAISRQLIDFTDVEITTDLETGQFEATFVQSVPGFDRGARLFGRYVVEDGHIVTAIAEEYRLSAAPVERRLSLW